MTQEEFFEKVQSLVPGMCYVYWNGQDKTLQMDGMFEVEHLKKLVELLEPATNQSELAAWQHIANEWADAACNGIQWLRNVKDGISKPEDGIAEMQENIEPIRGLPRFSDAAAQLTYDPSKDVVVPSKGLGVPQVSWDKAMQGWNFVQTYCAYSNNHQPADTEVQDAAHKFLRASDELRAAERPPNSHAPKPIIGYGHPAIVRYWDAYETLRVALNAAPQVQKQDASPDDLRAAGLKVAVHNDYRLAGKPHTFWLFTTADGRAIKGEGETDAEALNQVRTTLQFLGLSVETQSGVVK